MTPSPSPGDAEAVRRAVDAVLASPEFSGVDPDPSLLARLVEWLRSLFDGAGRWLEHVPSWVAWTMSAWMALTLLAVFGHTLFTLFRLGSRGATGAAARRRQRRGELLGITDLDEETVLAEARASLGRGEFDRAVRYAYAAGILLLDRVGLVEFETGKTNRDYGRELRGAPVTSERFSGMTDAFETIAYGSSPATAAISERMLADVAALEKEASVGRAA
ncbi:MAG TPA: DUF4129 domain-containing protein [Polyangiaceae bacterium]|nr:DUF4129 domain-containing protein [Polyangiaceae bacterium]